MSAGISDVYKRQGLETTKQMCQVWNGDWFSDFIFTLMPEVFVYRSFWIVPVFWTLSMIAATYYMVHEVFTNYFGLKWYEGGVVTLLILLMFYQWIPSSAIGMYWYVGVIHYMMPHVLAMLLIGFLLKYLRTDKFRYIIFSVFGMIAIGGSSYYSAFLVLFSYVLMFVIVKNKKRAGIFEMCIRDRHCTVDHGLLWDQYGIAGYTLSAGSQRLDSTYYFLKEAIREYYGSNVPLFRRNGYRQSGVMIP